MINKLLLNLKTEVFERIMLIYIGGRSIQPTLTKASMVSSIIENEFKKNSVVLCDKNYIGYTSNELFEKGVTIIKKPFTDILDIKNDERFYNTINDLKINIYCENRKVISDSIIENYINWNIAKVDITTICNIVFPLKSYEYDNGYISALLNGNEKEYWVLEEVDLICKRFKEIQDKLNYYNILSKFILEQYKKLSLNKRYYFSEKEIKEKNIALEFYNLFFQEIENNYKDKELINYPSDVNIESEFDESELKFLKQYLLIKIKDDDNNFYNYKLGNYLYYLIKEDLRKILSIALEIDFKDYLRYNWYGYEVFYTRNSFNRLLEKENLKTKNLYIGKYSEA